MIDDPVAVGVALDPVRSSMLAALVAPSSAASLAARVGLSRQKVNYHLKALEAHGLVELAEERAWGGITERLMRRTARRFVVSPDVLQGDAAKPDLVADRLSAGYLVALAARAVREVGALARHVAETSKRLPTLSIDTVVGFASAEDRRAFTSELQAAVAGIAARYHHDDGRPYRLVVAAYPRPQEAS